MCHIDRRKVYNLNLQVKIYLGIFLRTILDLAGGASDKEPTCQCRRRKKNEFDLSWEDPLEKGMATHSSILAWRIPMDRGAWRATVHRAHRVGHD